jgi:hypothetical protein
MEEPRHQRLELPTTEAIDRLPESDIPVMLGEIEIARARLWARLLRAQPPPTPDRVFQPPPNPDRVLSIHDLGILIGGAMASVLGRGSSR